MNIIEKLGIMPIEFIYGQLHGTESAYCYHTDLKRIENQRNELLEALLELMEGVDGLPPLTAIAGLLGKQWTTCEEALIITTGKPWEEIKELVK